MWIHSGGQRNRRTTLLHIIFETRNLIALNKNTIALPLIVIVKPTILVSLYSIKEEKTEIKAKYGN